MIMLAVVSVCMAQQNARNGCHYPPKGEIRIFMVFADIIDDPFSGEIEGWPAGELPEYADSLLDRISSNNVQGWISRYFQEMSYGELSIVGDYYPYLIEFQLEDMPHTSGVVITKAVTEYLDALPGNDVVTRHGYYLVDFDTWKYNPYMSYCTATHVPDNGLDLLLIVWRRCSNLFPRRDGGCAYSWSLPFSIKNLSHINGYIMSCQDRPWETLIHEFAHMLLGGNIYHTGGSGAGSEGHFLSNVGGYSILSSHNRNMWFCNGWDRWRLGWKYPGNNHYISARDSSGQELDADLVYGDSLEQSEFVLRPFEEFGDAIRIKLPHVKTLNPNARNQYVWIENHQVPPSSVEQSMQWESRPKPKGIRLNIQIGNDCLDADLFSSRSNYLVPLSAFGNYDFYYNPAETNEGESSHTSFYTARTNSRLSNPLCGYHLSMYPAIDDNGDDTILPKEYVAVQKVYKDNTLVADNWPMFGSEYDAFAPGTTISLSSNPPAVPLMTFCTGERRIGATLGTVSIPPKADDNRHIYLNGLRVDVVEQYADGSIKVRIRWDDYAVDKDVRWCGPIVMSERVELQPLRTITLDYGLTPTRPINPTSHNGMKVFSDATVFTSLNGSYFKQEPHSVVNVINKSSLVLDSGSVYEIGDQAELNVEQSGSLIVKSGATLRVSGKGHVEIKSGAYICLEAGAHVELLDTLSALNVHMGAQWGLSPAMNETVGCNCAGSPTVLTIEGSGNIHASYATNRCIQNITYTQDAYEHGNFLEAGHHVCVPPLGNVEITGGANVIFDGEGDVLLDAGVKVMIGSSLEIR